MASYVATDDDLPDIFWEDGKRPASQSPHESLRGTVAIQVHFPAIISKTAKQERREQRAIERDKRDSATESKKHFVQLGKKTQMYGWLLALENTFAGMDFRERDFCEKLLLKFRKYTPERAKWVTRAQFNWLKFISERYLWTGDRLKF